jgi:quercetin dioxygenase-like cupin family protein
VPVTLIRSDDLPTQDFGSVQLVSLANPTSGAVNSIILRGLVSAGAEFPAHSHDEQEILIFLAGRAAYTIGEEAGMIAAGDVILIPAGLVHSFEAQEDIDAIAVLPAGAKTFAPDGSLLDQRV